MSISNASRYLVTLFGMGLPTVLMGCDSTGHAQFKPSGDEARTALTAALTAWQSGKPFGQVDADPPVRVADSLWQGGRKLQNFEIGDEEDPGDGTKQFDVTITTTPGSKAEHVRYVVNGRNPTWIFSADDYKRTLNMDNNPAPPTAKSKRRPQPR